MDDIKHILLKYFRGELSAREQQELDRWMELDEENRALFDRVNDSRFIVSALEKMDRMDEQGVWQKIVSQRNPPVNRRRFSFLRFGWTKYAAAIVLLATGLFVYFYFFSHSLSQDLQTNISSSLKNDVLPGGNGAVLTLSDGSKIILDSAGNGLLLSQGNTKIVKMGNGQLSYEDNGVATEEILFNTLSTDRGKQFHVVLPDGTGVWLNAASSLHYPMAFKGKERRVTVTGEAYFEIAKNAAMPFIVSVNDQEVTALGTSFNINAYKDEELAKTTLLEGFVKVAGATSSVTLKPGQQSVIGAGGNIYVQETDVQSAVAWKNGYFSFTNAGLHVIMRQLARWYDVDVVYEGEIPKVEFSGEIGRTLTLGQLLDILKETRIHYRIEEKKLIIMS